MASKRVDPLWTPARARAALDAAGFVRDRRAGVFRRTGRPVSKYVEPEARELLEARGIDADDSVIPLEGAIAFRAVIRTPGLVGEIALGILAERIRLEERTEAAA